MSKEDNAINYFNKRIKSWLQEEIEHNEPVKNNLQWYWDIESYRR